MIIKRFFNPWAVLRYVAAELMFSVAITAAVAVLVHTEILSVGIPLALVGLLGSALAIFIAFRNNAAYGRWWEARTLWAQVLASSRNLARQIVANSDNAVQAGKKTPEEAKEFQHKFISRQIEYAYALRQHLLQPDPNATHAEALNQLLLAQTQQLKAGIRTEVLGPFDSISLEPALSGLVSTQAALERIKNTPLLRQYHFFTQVFLYCFMLLLPASLVPEWHQKESLATGTGLSVLLAFVFACLNKVGEVNEAPFEGEVTDVPMLQTCHELEADLHALMGHDHERRSATQEGYVR